MARKLGREASFVPFIGLKKGFFRLSSGGIGASFLHAQCHVRQCEKSEPSDVCSLACSFNCEGFLCWPRQNDGGSQVFSHQGPLAIVLLNPYPSADCRAWLVVYK